MYIVAIAWMFVVVCMAAVEATTTSLLGALVTLMFYGIVPLGLLLWLIGTPRRRRGSARHAGVGASFDRRCRRRRNSARDDQ